MSEVWYGLDHQGRKVSIEHQKLMDWAFRKDKQITVGWSNFFEWNGSRLVRGDDPVAEARKQGWDDLADLLESDLESDTSIDQAEGEDNE